MENITDIAIKKARRSYCKYKISAVALDKQGNVLATAVNRPRFSREGGGVHAEMVVLEKAGPSIHTIVICRVGNKGDLLPIHPCKNCQKVLDKKGIRVYSVT